MLACTCCQFNLAQTFMKNTLSSMFSKVICQILKFLLSHVGALTADLARYLPHFSLHSFAICGKRRRRGSANIAGHSGSSAAARPNPLFLHEKCIWLMMRQAAEGRNHSCTLMHTPWKIVGKQCLQFSSSPVLHK